MFLCDICLLRELHAPAAVSVRLYIYYYPLLLHDLEKTTFTSPPLSWAIYSQINDSYR